MQRELTHRTFGLRTVFRKTLRDQRHALIWWAVGFLAVVLMYTAFWPNIRNNADQFTKYLHDMPKFVRNMIGGVDFMTPEGYVQSELFSFMAPILLLVYAIGAGARAIAGEEEAGSLDLLLSTPARRRRILLDKFAALVVPVVGFIVVLWLAVVAFGPLFDLRPDLGGFTAMSLNTMLLGLAFGSVALAIGAATGRKSLAIGMPSGIAVMTYVLNVLAPSVDWLEPFRLLSPFYYYSGGDPIVNGLDPLHAFVLAAISFVAVAYALWAFERRDLAA